MHLTELHDRAWLDNIVYLRFRKEEDLRVPTQRCHSTWTRNSLSGMGNTLLLTSTLVREGRGYKLFCLEGRYTRKACRRPSMEHFWTRLGAFGPTHKIGAAQLHAALLFKLREERIEWVLVFATCFVRLSGSQLCFCQRSTSVRLHTQAPVAS